MSISIWMVFLDVYFNWPLKALKSDKKCASYGQNTKTGRNRKIRTGCTGTPLKCTGTHWVMEGCTVTHDPKMPRMCVFSHFSIFLILKSTLHFKHTSKPFPIHFGISFLFNPSLNYISFFKIHITNPSKTILIWVKTHTQTKHDV